MHYQDCNLTFYMLKIMYRYFVDWNNYLSEIWISLFRLRGGKSTTSDIATKAADSHQGADKVADHHPGTKAQPGNAETIAAYSSRDEQPKDNGTTRYSIDHGSRFQSRTGTKRQWHNQCCLSLGRV